MEGTASLLHTDPSIGPIESKTFVIDEMELRISRRMKFSRKTNNDLVQHREETVKSGEIGRLTSILGTRIACWFLPEEIKSLVTHGIVTLYREF